jgi:hypothetical protein
MKNKIVLSIMMLIPIYVTTIHGACTPHAATLGQTIWTSLDQIKSISGVSAPANIIYQSNIPYTISAPGTYSVGQDLTSTDANPVITIASPNVVLNLQGHTITQGGTPTTAISVSSGAPFISNGIIQGFTTGIANGSVSLRDIVFDTCTIALSAGSIVDVRDCVGISCGTFSSGVSSLTMIDSEMLNCTGDAIVNGSNILLNRAIIDGAVNGINLSGSAQLMVMDSSIGNLSGTGIIINNTMAVALRDSELTNITGDAILATGAASSFISIVRCVISNIGGDGVDIAASVPATLRLSMVESTIADVAGAGVRNPTVSGAASHVYNTFITNAVGGSFVWAATAPTAQTPAQVAANLTDFWQNVIFP